MPRYSGTAVFVRMGLVGLAYGLASFVYVGVLKRPWTPSHPHGPSNALLWILAPLVPVGDLLDDFSAGALILLQHHDKQRPLVPFRMPHADHGRLGHLGMAHRKVFQVDR